MKNKQEPNLNDVARFIGAALRYPVPRCNGSWYTDGTQPWTSTIMVYQHKVKFADIRIYCTLADQALVTERWLKTGHTGDPDQQFIDECYMFDARHYRDCYLSMLALLPGPVAQYVCESADYSLLLVADLEELDRAIAWNAEKWENGKYPQYLTHLCRRYGNGKTFDDVRQYVANVCRFKL
jgi:hypothetical protein